MKESKSELSELNRSQSEKIRIQQENEQRREEEEEEEERSRQSQQTLPQFEIFHIDVTHLEMGFRRGGDHLQQVIYWISEQNAVNPWS